MLDCRLDRTVFSLRALHTVYHLPDGMFSIGEYNGPPKKMPRIKHVRLDDFVQNLGYQSGEVFRMKLRKGFNVTGSILHPFLF